MTTGEVVAIVCACFSGVSLLVIVAEKLWGGGNALAARFHALEIKTTADVTALERTTTTAIAAVRAELNNRVDQYEDNYQVGLDAIKANIHALQMGLLEFRAKMAENYVPKGGVDDLKAEMRRSFETVDKHIGHLQDMIMWSNPDLPNRQPPQKIR